MQYITTAHEAELNAARVMREWGFVDAKATTGGSDGGIDVRSSGALAQVKWRGAQVSRDEIQKLYGARGLDSTKQLMFFAASGYSRPAITAANELRVALFTYDPLGHVRVENDVRVRAAVVNQTIDRDKILWLALTSGAAIAAIALMVAAITAL
ncbi:restriction endonuclease [Mycolicibacterium sp. S3B2]|uniref:restriction endonuclease n=1 Tax=Mycolicibacterium sp. S3B2 TaxID=3415120 RepID=UPI003C7D4350